MKNIKTAVAATTGVEHKIQRSMLGGRDDKVGAYFKTCEVDTLLFLAVSVPI